MPEEDFPESTEDFPELRAVYQACMQSQDQQLRDFGAQLGTLLFRFKMRGASITAFRASNKNLRFYIPGLRQRIERLEKTACPDCVADLCGEEHNP